MAFGQPNPGFLANMGGFLSGMGAQPQMQAPPAMPLAPQAPMAQAIQPPVAPIAQAVQARHGINWLGVLADALSGAAGQPGMYAQSMMRQKEHQRELDDYNRKRMDENTDWQNRYQYESTHPRPKDPVGYAAELAAMGLTPGTPEFNQRMSAHLNAVDDPLVTMTLPGDHVYSGPRSGLATALGGAAPNLDTTATVESGYRYIPGPGGRANQSNWKPLGGQSGQSSTGTFR